MNLADPTPLSRFVHRLAAASPLGGAERSALLALTGRVVHVETNRDIVLEGEKVAFASFVVSGLVGSFCQTESGGRQITGLHLEGEMANLHSVAVPPASEALQALTASTIVQVAHHALWDLADCYPALAAAFWRDSALRYAIAVQWMVNIGRRPALARMAHLFCEIGCRVHGRKGYDGLSFHFPATQTHLADMLGLTPVHVNRMVQDLRRRGLIRFVGRVVTIPDWNSLAEIGEFHGGYLQIKTEAPPAYPRRLAMASGGMLSH